MGKLQTSVGYCSCGQEIWLEYIRGGDQWSCRFFDEQGREVEVCPNCLARLEEDELESCV
jgi:hypothetical protein